MAYFGNAPAGVQLTGSDGVFVFTASGGETSVTQDDSSNSVSYAPGFVQVFVNGVRFVEGDDFTASDGSTISLTTALNASDVVVVVASDVRPLDDAVRRSGGSFTGDVSFPNVRVADGGTIGSASDADAITIDASGNVALSQALQLGDSTALTSLGADVWRLTVDNANNGTITGWERVDDQSNVYVGSGVTESSGVFTLPSTGYWLILLSVFANSDDSDGDAFVVARLQLNGSDIASTSHNSPSTGGGIETTGATHALVDITNTSTQTISVRGLSIAGANSKIRGDSTLNATSIAFLRVGDN